MAILPFTIYHSWLLWLLAFSLLIDIMFCGVDILVLLGFGSALTGSVGRTETQNLAHLEKDLSGIVDTLELVGTGALGVNRDIWKDKK